MSKEMLEKTKQASEEVRQGLEKMLGEALDLHEMRFAYSRKDHQYKDRSLGGVFYLLVPKDNKDKVLVKIMYSDLSAIIGSSASDEIITQPTKYSTPEILARANEIVAKYSKR